MRNKQIDIGSSGISVRYANPGVMDGGNPVLAFKRLDDLAEYNKTSCTLLVKMPLNDNNNNVNQIQNEKIQK